MALLSLCLLLLAAAAVDGGKVPALIVFGDSSVDAGNNNRISTVLKSNFQPYGRDFPGGKSTGRFSNGRIPTDFISQFFGIKPTVPAYLDPAYSIADFATGVCFASAGTGYDNATSDVLSVIPLYKQLEYFKEYQARLRAHAGKAEAERILGEALYLMSMGTNDFLENYYVMPGRRSELGVAQYQDFLAGIAGGFVRAIYAAGARKVSLGGLPPMGCLPLERSTNLLGQRACVSDYNSVAQQFNGKLVGVVGELNRQLPGARVVFSDTYAIFMRIIRSPGAYGFEVVARACCSTGTFEMGYMCDNLNPLTCTDASKYVFWDAFHPTQKTSLIMAAHLVKHALKEFM